VAEIQLCNSCSRQFLTCIKYTQHLHHFFASPLSGSRNHEFTPDASNTVREPGELSMLLMRSATPHKAITSAVLPHRGVCPRTRCSHAMMKPCGDVQLRLRGWFGFCGVGDRVLPEQWLTSCNSFPRASAHPHAPSPRHTRQHAYTEPKASGRRKPLASSLRSTPSSITSMTLSSLEREEQVCEQPLVLLKLASIPPAYQNCSLLDRTL
jgi:hypothetical protein